MTVHHVYGDESGETHLRIIELPELAFVVEGVERIRGLVNLPATSVGLVEMELSAPPSQEMRPAPARRLLVFLSGTTQVKTTSGEEVLLYAGDCLLADDVNTKGHLTTDMGSTTRATVSIDLDPGWQPPAP